MLISMHVKIGEGRLARVRLVGNIPALYCRLDISLHTTHRILDLILIFLRMHVLGITNYWAVNNNHQGKQGHTHDFREERV